MRLSPWCSDDRQRTPPHQTRQVPLEPRLPDSLPKQWIPSYTSAYPRGIRRSSGCCQRFLWHMGLHGPYLLTPLLLGQTSPSSNCCLIFHVFYDVRDSMGPILISSPPPFLVGIPEAMPNLHSARGICRRLSWIYTKQKAEWPWHTTARRVIVASFLLWTKTPVNSPLETEFHIILGNR